MANVIFIGTDSDLTYSGASHAGSYLNAGTCTYALKSAAGATLGTGTLSYVAASSGDYAGTIESGVTGLLADGQRVYLEVTFLQSPYDDFRRIEYFAAYRGLT